MVETDIEFVKKWPFIKTGYVILDKGDGGMECSLCDTNHKPMEKGTPPADYKTCTPSSCVECGADETWYDFETIEKLDFKPGSGEAEKKITNIIKGKIVIPNSIS